MATTGIMARVIELKGGDDVTPEIFEHYIGILRAQFDECRALVQRGEAPIAIRKMEFDFSDPWNAIIRSSFGIEAVGVAGLPGSNAGWAPLPEMSE